MSSLRPDEFNILWSDRNQRVKGEVRVFRLLKFHSPTKNWRTCCELFDLIRQRLKSGIFANKRWPTLTNILTLVPYGFLRLTYAMKFLNIRKISHKQAIISAFGVIRFFPNKHVYFRVYKRLRDSASDSAYVNVYMILSSIL